MVPIYTLRTSAQIAALPPLQWRVKGILPTTGLAAIFGSSGSGKSFLAIDIAAAIALGNSWFGFHVRQAPVAYIALEGEGGISKRLRAWERANECNLPDDMRFVLGEEFNITDDAHVRQLASLIKHGSTIVIDTLNRAMHGADENSSKDMGTVLAGCKLLQNLTNSLVILVHHTGKDETKGMRGHSSLLAALDTAIEVIRDDDDRSWRVAKSKDDVDGMEFMFRLDVKFLGSDEDGDPITSCAIEQLATVAVPRSKKKLKGNQQAVFDAIYESLQSCHMLPWDEAVELAVKALDYIPSKNRRPRALVALTSLITSRKLVRDEDTNLITLP